MTSFRAKPAQRCTHVKLATGPIGNVEHCRGCGCVAINIGATTLRLEPRAFVQLVGTLRSAAEALVEAECEQTLPMSPGGSA